MGELARQLDQPRILYRGLRREAAAAGGVTTIVDMPYDEGNLVYQHVRVDIARDTRTAVLRIAAPTTPKSAVEAPTASCGAPRRNGVSGSAK